MAPGQSNGNDLAAPQPTGSEGTPPRASGNTQPASGGLLAGKRLLITGVMTKDSIAWAVADEAQRAGADVVLTSFGRTRRMTARASEQSTSRRESAEAIASA